MIKQEQFKNIKKKSTKRYYYRMVCLRSLLLSMLKEDAGDIERRKKEPSPQDGNKKKKKKEIVLFRQRREIKRHNSNVDDRLERNLLPPLLEFTRAYFANQSTVYGGCDISFLPMYVFANISALYCFFVVLSDAPLIREKRSACYVYIIECVYFVSM